MKRLSKLAILALLVFFVRTPFTNSFFVDQVAITSNSVTTSCWLPPSVPLLVSPANNTIAGLGSSWQRNPLMDWSDSSTSCPLATAIAYQYESYRDPGLTVLAFRSGWLSASQIPAPGTPEGDYYWRVRSKDNFGNVSDFSPPWKLTVDLTPPSAPTLQVTGSYTKSVEETIQNGSFESGLSGWSAAGDYALLTADAVADPATAVTPADGLAMLRLGLPEGQPPCDGFNLYCDYGKYVWENRLMGSFDSGAKSLSFLYNFFSRDLYPFDTPGFAVKLNGQSIFALNPSHVNPANLVDGQARSTGWQEFYYDLSDQDLPNSLVFYAGNNRSDNQVQSWAYLDKITTYFVSAPLHAAYSFSGGGASIAYYRYQLDSLDWQNVGAGETFMVTTPGTHTIRYFAVDTAGNESVERPLVKIIVDGTAPANVTDLSASSPSANSLTLSWTAPGNDGALGRAATYDLRYSISPIDDGNFASAAKITTSSPQSSGQTETVVVSGLNPSTTYYFALKSADEAPNWSGLSNLAFASTAAGFTVNPGDIIINEVVWIEGSRPEQLIELHNTTSRSLNDLGLLNLKLNGLYVQNFAGHTLSPGGYLLVSNVSAAGTNLLPSVRLDLPSSSFSLSRASLDLTLEYSGVIIDVAWNSTLPVTEGLVDSTPAAEKYYSLERAANTNLSGNDPLSWYTCLDPSSSSEFFQAFPGVDFRATPRSQNRSVNEPFSQTSPSPRPTATPTPIPFEPLLDYRSSSRQLKLTVQNIPDSFVQNSQNRLDYEIIYTASSGQQGIAGQIPATGVLPPSLSRDFYLGTCSENGVCTPQLGIGSSFVLNLTTIMDGSSHPQTKTFDF